MSACMRSLYSSDHFAPGFCLALSCGCGVGSVVAASRGDFRAPALSLRVGRVDEGLNEEFEWLIRELMAPQFDWSGCLDVELNDKRHYRHWSLHFFAGQKRNSGVVESESESADVESVHEWIAPWNVKRGSRVDFSMNRGQDSTYRAECVRPVACVSKRKHPRAYTPRAHWASRARS